MALCTAPAVFGARTERSYAITWSLMEATLPLPAEMEFVDVLVRKSGTGKPVADRLLIYTREFALHVADEGYSTVVMDAVSEFSKSGGALGYAAVYVVDEHACVEL